MNRRQTTHRVLYSFLPRAQCWPNGPRFFIAVNLVGTLLVTAAIVSTNHPNAANAANALVLDDLVGTPSPAEPSGMSPPAVNALAGYTRSYVSDFNNRSLPAGWFVFYGVPGGDPGGHFGLKHVRVGGGLLQLTTWRDPAYQNQWVTGGLCQCSVGQIYGAYFVRSRITGPGPNEVQLLWPITNHWPPEIDFNETGAKDMSTSSTLHYGPTNLMNLHHLRIDMTKWHTWGVIWTATAVIYVVDGTRWAVDTNPSQIPHVRMRLDFEQRAMCSLHKQCPNLPQAMYVDWVAEYVRTPTPSTETTTMGVTGSTTLTTAQPTAP